MRQGEIRSAGSDTVAAGRSAVPPAVGEGAAGREMRRKRGSGRLVGGSGGRLHRRCGHSHRGAGSAGPAAARTASHSRAEAAAEISRGAGLLRRNEMGVHVVG